MANFYRCGLVLVLGILICGCRGGGDGGGENSSYFMPSLPDELIGTTYKSEITWGGNISGDDVGWINIHNALTGESTAAEINSKEKCYWAIWFIILIPVDFCVTDYTYVATVLLDVGINPITVTAMDNTGVEVIAKSYSVERYDFIRLDELLSDLTLEEVAFDQPFRTDLLSYTASVCAKVPQVRLIPTVSEDFIQWEADNGLRTVDDYLDISLSEGINELSLHAFLDPVPEFHVFTEKFYTLSINRALATGATLNDLVLSAGSLDSVFDPTQAMHTTHVDFVDKSVQLAIYPADPCADISLNGLVVSNGEFGAPVVLGEGPNLISINVDDGITARKYYLMTVRDSIAEFVQSTYIKASDTDDADNFGANISLEANTLAVGATGNADAVYVLAKDTDGAWSQQALMRSPGTESGDRFGHAVALSENTLAVSAYYDNRSGAVYVFTRDVTGGWTQQALIKASNAGLNDYFGKSIALDGDTLVVGAPNEDSLSRGINGSQEDDMNDFYHERYNSGAVYVFTRDGAGTWTQQAYIKASNADGRVGTRDGDYFGSSVALEDDTLAVGAIGEDSSATGVNGDEWNNDSRWNGAVYIFARDVSSKWSQQAYIKASNSGYSDYFGRSLALSGETLAVGAEGESSEATGIDGDQENNSAYSSGAVYIFTREAGINWSQQAYLKASNTDSRDMFGLTISLEDDTLVVGAIDEDSLTTGVNSEPGEDSSVNNDTGAVYMFKRSAGGLWSQQEYIKASNTDTGDSFGSSVALSGEMLAIGAMRESSMATGIDGDQADNSYDGSGAVYLFE